MRAQMHHRIDFQRLSQPEIKCDISVMRRDIAVMIGVFPRHGVTTIRLQRDNQPV